VVCGNVLDVLRGLPDECVDTIVTSPPYWGLRDYGDSTVVEWSDGWRGQLGLEPTLDLYLSHLLQITAELKRVLKPTGVCFWNHGDNYGSAVSAPNAPKMGNRQHKPRPAIGVHKCLNMQNYELIRAMVKEQGWILRNQIIWNKPNPMPFSGKKRFANKWEPVFMLVKNTKIQYYYNDKTLQNADRKPKELIEGRDWDWIGCPKCYGTGIAPNELASVLISLQYMESPRPTVTEKVWLEYTKPLERCPRCKGTGKVKCSHWHGLDYWFDLDAVRREPTGRTDPITHFGRYNKQGAGYKLNAIKGANPGDVWDTMTDKELIKALLETLIDACKGDEQIAKQRLRIHLGTEPGYSDLWELATHQFPEAHFATFPPKLVEPMIKAACPQWICPVCGKARVRVTKIIQHKTSGNMGRKGGGTGYGNGIQRSLAEHQTLGWTSCQCNAGWRPGVTLDPFGGSGTTGMVAKKLGRDYIIIDANPGYCKMARKRIAEVPLRLL